MSFSGTYADARVRPAEVKAYKAAGILPWKERHHYSVFVIYPLTI